MPRAKHRCRSKTHTRIKDEQLALTSKAWRVLDLTRKPLAELHGKGDKLPWL
jgi:hypothetical protein